MWDTTTTARFSPRLQPGDKANHQLSQRHFHRGAAVVLPAADESRDRDFDVEAEPDSPNEDIINKGISLLEQTDTTPMDTGSKDTNCGSSSADQDPRARKISSRLRSSVNKDLPQPDSANPNKIDLFTSSTWLPSAPLKARSTPTPSTSGPSASTMFFCRQQSKCPTRTSKPWPHPTQPNGRKPCARSSTASTTMKWPISSPSPPFPPAIPSSRWVYRVKTDGRFKARIVVQGWAHQHGIDCFTTFAPVCRISSQRMLLAIAASYGWPVVAMNVQTAFLNGALSENLYTKQAPGFEKIDSSTGKPYVWKLRKSLYGLRQSPNVWNLTIDRDLRRKGFTPTASEACVYTKGSGNSYVVLTLFVDDILLTGPSEQVLQGVRRDLQQSFSMTDMGEATQILGTDIK